MSFNKSPIAVVDKTNIQWLSTIAAGMALMGALLSLLGWVADIPRLLDWVGSGITIKANASIGVTLSAAALLVYVVWPRARIIIIVLAGAVVLLAGGTLAEHISNSDLGIDGIFFREAPGSPATVSPGRMNLPGATSLFLLGLAQILVLFNARTRLWASWLGTAVIGIASLSLVGYAFGASQLFGIPKFTGIAFQTAFILAAVGIGITWSVRESGVAASISRDDLGGIVFRSLIIPAILAALIIGWLELAGIKLGLYDAAFGTAARTLVEIALLLALLWRTTSEISRAEATTLLVARLPAESPHPVVRLSENGGLLYSNAAANETGIDWEASGTDPVAAQLRGFSQQALLAGERRVHEVDIASRLFTCSLVPVVEAGYVNIYAADITDRKLSEETASRRAHEQESLYRFTSRLNRSSTLSEVFEAALETIIDALQCHRASILLFDSDDKMSFVASRGLSDEYKSAVDGHSPWTPTSKNAIPFAIDDITASQESDEIKSAIVREGILALGFIPLIVDERVIGKFMVYRDEAPPFTSRDLDLGLAIGYQVAFSVERRRREEKFRENEERLRVATETGKVGVWDWDMATNSVSWTESVYVMHGVKPGEFDGKVESFSKLIHPDEREMVTGRIQAALAGTQPYEIEFRVVHPDGAVRWLFTNAVVLRNGQEPYRMIGATVDITEIKQTQIELSKLAAIVRSSTDAVISKDLNGVVTSWNQAAENVFGYTAEEMVGTPITILIPEDRADEEQSFLERIRRGIEIAPYETIRRRKDGTLIRVALTISPIRDAAGVIVGASKIARDITERKAAEEALRKNEIMHTLVEAQESERNRIARDLHDHLGQQLTALRLKLETIRTKALESNVDWFEEVDETRERASKIDLDINFLSWELRPTELDKLGLKDAVSSFVREWSTNYGIEAEFHAAGDRVDRLSPDLETNLYRIVQEGLNNILKHAEATKVSVILERKNSGTLLIIEDNGIGFDPESASPKDNGRRGRAMGLRGMKERAALFGGTLEIESRPGQGTSLFARIPDPPAAGSAADTAPAISR